ncbi:MAG: HAMP domain-containing protein [Gemmatimonadetes bacterium]|jgi:two-component system, NtrC family, sensor kinase|nr:HAMP domain-containing protein [Gemmatimonadota bacterium]
MKADTQTARASVSPLAQRLSGWLRRRPIAAQMKTPPPVNGPRFGLEAKFVLLATVGILLATSIGNRLILLYQEALLEEETRSKAVLLAESMARSFEYTLIYEDLGLVEEAGLLDLFVEDMTQRRDLEVLFVELLDPQGRIRAHSDYRRYGEDDEAFAARFPNGLKETQVKRVLHEGQEMIEVATPLRIASRSWGDVVIGVSLNPMRRELAAFADRLGYLTLTAIAVSVLLSFLVAHALARPIKRLASAMAGVGPQLETDLQVDRRDEIGLLQSGFLEMVARLRQSRQEQERTREAMLRAEKLAAVGSLAAGVAHEVNNPLGGIRNCLEQLERGGASPERSENYLRLMRQALDRIQAVVSGLLDFSRRRELAASSLDLAGVIGSSVELLSYRIQKGGITLDLDVPGDLPALRGDAHQLQQVVVNVLLNALDAIDARGGTGSIGIHAEATGDRVLIHVDDSGIGIEEEESRRIFDPFYTTKEVGKGTGLGLTVSLHILREHGGDLSCRPRREGGSRFTFSLPVDDAKEVQP